MTVAVVAFGLPIRMNRSKKSPVAPSAKNHCVSGAVMPALSMTGGPEQPMAAQIHRALDDDRLVGGRSMMRGDLRVLEPGLAVDVDVGARVGADRVRALDRRGRRGSRYVTVYGDRLGVRILNQVIQLEAADRRAFGADTTSRPGALIAVSRVDCRTRSDPTSSCGRRPAAGRSGRPSRTPPTPMPRAPGRCQPACAR